MGIKDHTRSGEEGLYSVCFISVVIHTAKNREAKSLAQTLDIVNGGD